MSGTVKLLWHVLKGKKKEEITGTKSLEGEQDPPVIRPEIIKREGKSNQTSHHCSAYSRQTTGITQT